MKKGTISQYRLKAKTALQKAAAENVLGLLPSQRLAS